MDSHGWNVLNASVIPDNRETIAHTLMAWCDGGMLDVLLTTGGTGFAPRDITPEATRAVIDRPAPGLVEAMRSASLAKTQHAMLSRAEAGIRGRTLIVNLPGSPRGAIENLEVILPVLPHAVELMRDDPESELGHHQLKQQ
jgi:molybdopterin adenylyltransferase